MSVAEDPAEEPVEKTAGHEAESPAAAASEAVCDLCGTLMYEWHCRLVCPACGYQRDCSDP